MSQTEPVAAETTRKEVRITDPAAVRAIEEFATSEGYATLSGAAASMVNTFKSLNKLRSIPVAGTVRDHVIEPART